MRVCFVAGLVGLLALVFIFAGEEQVRAAPGDIILQDTPGYDAPTSEDSGNGYDAPATDIPDVEVTVEDTPDIFTTVQPTFTAVDTATLPPDLFRTEDTEMNQSITTPVVTETPGPTLTMVATPTVLKTKRGPTPTLVGAAEKDTFQVDWGMFLAGFSLPVLGGCGYVLYLLDRRPELFKRFRR